MTANELLCELNAALGYNFEEHELEIIMLTHTRYTKIKSIAAAYFASGDKTKAYKMTVEEIPLAALPKAERKELDAYEEE
jgi:hypothetical protein